MIFRGVPLPSIFFFLPVRTLDLLFGGGGGGGGEYFVRRLCFFCFVYRCFGFVVLVLVVYSIFSLFRILVVFCF